MNSGSPMARRSLLAVLLIAALALLPAMAGAADTTPPYAVSWSPQGTGVPVTTSMTVVWSERMNWTSVERAFRYSDANGTYTAGSWIIDGAANASTFTPATPLHLGTAYTVTVLQTATDEAGNLLDQDRNGVPGEPCVPPATGDCVVWHFETELPPPDTTPPRVLSTSPAAGATAPADAAIEVRFSERMDTASVEASFTYGDGVSLYTARDGTVSWTSTNATDDTFRFAPRLRFASGGSVAVDLAGRVAKDAAGNLLDGGGNGSAGYDHAWTFSVAPDPEPPRVLMALPAQDAANVLVETNVRIVFSKAMDRAAISEALTLGGPGGPALTAANGTLAWSGTSVPDDTLLFNPYPNLRTSTAYTFRLDAARAADREGIRLDGNGDGVPGDDFLLNFTTETQDLTPPTVVATDPAAGATDVVATASIEMAFSEPMDTASVQGAFSYTDGATTWRIGDGTGSWNPADDALTFQPAAALSYGTRYTVTVSPAATDGAGNPLNGGAPATWNFTTAGQADVTPPWIVSSSPFDGQENVSRTARISIIFSEAMDKRAVQASVGITNGAVLTGFDWPNDATLTAATASPMGYGAPYVVFVLTGAKDLAGNPMVQPREIGFTTAPWRGRVTGRVVDTAGAGIGGALVQLGARSLLAGGGGDFSFEGIVQGAYTLTVSAPGFATFSGSVDIGPDSADLGVVALERPAAVIDVTLWAGVGTVLFAAVVVAAILLRIRRKPPEHVETWKPAKVVVMEPGLPPRDRP